VKSPGDFDRLVSTYAPDFIVCGADYPPIIIHKWATLTSLKYNVPVIFGGIGIESSSLGPLLDSATSKNNYIEWLDKKLSLIRPESLRPVRGSLASTNMAGSSLLAFEIFKFFTKSETCLSLGTRLLFDFKTYSVSKRECFNGKS
jgi:hypothetical protein